jgi:hypothetical protein
MIDFNKINFDKKMLKDIQNIGNSCGVISCYALSEIFDFDFDIEEFRGIGEGMKAKEVQAYAKSKGVDFICKESEGIEGNSSVGYADYDILLKNNIVADISGVFTYSDKRVVPHTEIAIDIKDNLLLPLYSQRMSLNSVENLYITFFYKNANISEFVEFKSCA